MTLGRSCRPLLLCLGRTEWTDALENVSARIGHRQPDHLCGRWEAVRRGCWKHPVRFCTEAITPQDMNKNAVQQLTDEQLLRDLQTAAAHEHEPTARLVELLSEMDTRRLYLPQGYSSLFVYCTKCLRLSEHAAYLRIEAARIASKISRCRGMAARRVTYADQPFSSRFAPDGRQSS